MSALSDDGYRRGGHHRAAAGGKVTAPAEAVSVLTMTDARTGDAHLVTEDAMLTGRQAGRYASVCGAEVLPASLTTAERGYCRSCAQWRAAR